MELRKRRPTARFGDSVTLDVVLNIVERCRHIIFFTGSGISAASGMSMFSTRNGLYERARKKFKVQDGIKLFTYSFYRQRRAEVQDFFAQIYSEAQASRAATGHHAMAQVLQLGALQRHYTLNIDGLSEVVGMDTWHHERNPQGSTVEMHGNIRQLVCPTCHAVESLSRHNINLMRAQQPVPCSACGQDQLRFKVMLYDDGEGDCITPEHVFDVLEEDLKACDMVVWAGISFQQSASVEYFRRVRHMLGTLGRLNAVPQVLINPSEEPYFNLLSAMSNPNELQLLDLRETSDVAFPAMAERLRDAIMHEDHDEEGIGGFGGAAGPTTAAFVAPLINGITGYGGHAAVATAAAAAAALAAPAVGLAGASAFSRLEVAPQVPLAPPAAVMAVELLPPPAPLRLDLAAKEEMQVANVKFQAGPALEPAGTKGSFGTDACLHFGSCNGSAGGGPVERLVASGGGAGEADLKSARGWHLVRNTKAQARGEADNGDDAVNEPLFMDNADDEDYVEGVEEEEGRCRRNVRGRGRGRVSAGRGRARGRGRGRGSSGGGSRPGSNGSGGAGGQVSQGAHPPSQSPLGLLRGLTPGAGPLMAPELSVMPLGQPGLRLALGGLAQQQQPPSLAQPPLLFQQPQALPQPQPQLQQPALQQLQQLQQLVQLQQLAQLRQQQQQNGLELLQRLQALQQLQNAQQQQPSQVQGVCQLHPPGPQEQGVQQSPQQLPPVQLLGSLSSLLQHGGATPIQLRPQEQQQQQQQQQLLEQREQQQQMQQEEQQRQQAGPQPVQGQDLQMHMQLLAELQQRALLQQFSSGAGSEGGPGVS